MARQAPGPLSPSDPRDFGCPPICGGPAGLASVEPCTRRKIAGKIRGFSVRRSARRMQPHAIRRRSASAPNAHGKRGGSMKQLVAGTIAAAIALVLAPHTLSAQAKTVASQVRTETGTIEAIDAANRAVTFKKPDGTYVTTVAGQDIKRFGELKVGDTVTAKYYENLIVRVKQPGESD